MEREKLAVHPGTSGTSLVCILTLRLCVLQGIEPRARSVCARQVLHHQEKTFVLESKAWTVFYFLGFTCVCA